MKIDCFFIAWNEAETIHLTIRHYQKFCRSVTVFDNFSTDNTRDIAEENGAIVKLFGVEGQLNDHEYLKVKNNCWKGSDADWVIVCDADEILYHQYLGEFLAEEKAKGTSIISPAGYSMYSNDAPRETWFDIRTGIRDEAYSKLICFDPKAITEIGYIYGCHEAKPQGRVKYATDQAKLLHYKYVGGIERTLARHRLYEARKAPINRRWNLGHVYGMNEDLQRKNFYENLEASKPVI